MRMILVRDHGGGTLRATVTKSKLCDWYQVYIGVKVLLGLVEAARHTNDEFNERHGSVRECPALRC